MPDLWTIAVDEEVVGVVDTVKSAGECIRVFAVAVFVAGGMSAGQVVGCTEFHTAAAGERNLSPWAAAEEKNLNLLAAGGGRNLSLRAAAVGKHLRQLALEVVAVVIRIVIAQRLSTGDADLDPHLLVHSQWIPRPCSTFLLEIVLPCSLAEWRRAWLVAAVDSVEMGQSPCGVVARDAAWASLPYPPEDLHATIRGNPSTEEAATKKSAYENKIIS